MHFAGDADTLCAPDAASKTVIVQPQVDTAPQSSVGALSDRVRGEALMGSDHSRQVPRLSECGEAVFCSRGGSQASQRSPDRGVPGRSWPRCTRVGSQIDNAVTDAKIVSGHIYGRP